MIKATFGIKQEPFNRNDLTLLPQQRKIMDIIKIHSQHGGFSVVIGAPGVGKTVLREHLESLATERDNIVASCSRTMHIYLNIVRQHEVAALHSRTRLTGSIQAQATTRAST